MSNDCKRVLVTNLLSGIDDYDFPTMERSRTLYHPFKSNHILQTAVLPDVDLVVAGGDNGEARVFNRTSGQLVSSIGHAGEFSI
ncbi:hypothetical protein BC834DRAFT_835790 [Gloeopeniophorella convolvens]|nr:hypothetical protein BC834DRAFT_835790 [Gloeopeniophorella convolvens]